MLHCFCAHRHARAHAHAEQAVLLQFERGCRDAPKPRVCVCFGSVQ